MILPSTVFSQGAEVLVHLYNSWHVICFKTKHGNGFVVTEKYMMRERYEGASALQMLGECWCVCAKLVRFNI